MGKIILALGVCDDWQDFMPQLVQLAKDTPSPVHVLETAAPVGTGTFTSIFLMMTNTPPVNGLLP
jgi:hypothetical protein